MKQPQHGPILIVEDSDSDYEATLWALGTFATSVPHVRCQNGEEVKEYLETRGRFASDKGGPVPSLVLLDLNLPGMDGREVLRYIRVSSPACTLPVLILTSSSNPVEIEACYRGGANSCFLKPLDLLEYKKLLELIVQYWLENAVLPRART